MCRFKRKRENETALAVVSKRQNCHDKMRDQTFNCVNIVLSEYIEWPSQEVKRTKVNLLVSSSDQE